MTTLREAAQQALEALERIDQADNDCDFLNPSQYYQLDEAMTALRAALAEPQSTHSDDCWKWHHECAIARIEELKLLCEEMLSELYVYRASKHLKDVTAAIRARGEK